MTQHWSFQAEYEALKTEQLARIGFRDNMVYISLTVIGAVAGFAMTDKSHLMALLVLPWANAILGWMYLSNDAKISAIGSYLRDTLATAIRKEPDCAAALDWEYYHRKTRGRFRRKVTQFVVDVMTFVISGFIAIIAYVTLSGCDGLALSALISFEFLILIVLLCNIVAYADFF